MQLRTAIAATIVAAAACLLAASYPALADTAESATVDMAAHILPPPAPPSDGVKPYLTSDAPVVVLRNVRIIDGTGAPAVEDRSLLIEEGRIAAIGEADMAVPEGAEELDLAGRSLIPGLVGMHDHLFYVVRTNLHADGTAEPPGLLAPQMTFTSPRLYLAGGVTTLRTTGSVEPYADLNLRADINAGKLPGPHLDVTGPYLEGDPSLVLQQHRMKGPEDARQFVDYWADQGVTSFKAYEHITRADLKAAIEAAHRHGIKVTGHLCAVSYSEAIDLGIDNIEHGFWKNTELDPGREPDKCHANPGTATLLAMDPTGPVATALIEKLVENGVAITSTHAVFEPNIPGYEGLPPEALEVMTPQAREDYLTLKNVTDNLPDEYIPVLEKTWANASGLERAFVDAGGLLLVGSDPTGAGQVIPGFSNHRAIELLVKGGFTPLEAIKAATLNGAIYLGLEDRIGSIAVGKNADLVVIEGDPSSDISDIRNVEIVFKDGLGYDSAALRESVRGRYGQY